MVMIQDGPQNTGADKPLRISGEPFKVQVRSIFCHVNFLIKMIHFLRILASVFQPFFHFWSLLYSKPKKW